MDKLSQRLSPGTSGVHGENKDNARQFRKVGKPCFTCLTWETYD